MRRQRAWITPWLAGLSVHRLNGGDPQNTWQDNIQCCALLFAAVESAHTGQTVDVQDFLQRYLAGV